MTVGSKILAVIIFFRVTYIVENDIDKRRSKWNKTSIVG